MKKIIIITILLLIVLSSFGYAQRYYWQGKEKRFFEYIPNMTVFYSTDTLAISKSITKSNHSNNARIHHFSKKNKMMYSIHKGSLEKSISEPTLYKSNAMLLGKDTVFLSNQVVVKLKNVSDTKKLEKIIKKYSARISEVIYDGLYILELEDPNQTISCANKIYESGIADWCEPDFLTQNIKVNTWDDEQYYLYNPYGHNLSFNNINVFNAWSITKGCEDIRVAVLDYGVDDHIALKDINGQSRVLPGYSIFSEGPQDGRSGGEHFHGQGCAGIIAASHNSEIRGIAPNVKIVPVKMLSNTFNERLNSSTADAIRWAFDSRGGNADILSNSWGVVDYNNWSPQIKQAIYDAQLYGRGGDYRTQKKGLGSVVVFSSGNDGLDRVNPYSEAAISVGALGKGGDLARLEYYRNFFKIYSNKGVGLDLVAFGGDCIYRGNQFSPTGEIKTLSLQNTYINDASGTSFACPQVSGVAALILSVNPKLTVGEVESILFTTATDLGKTGKDLSYGHGRLNAFEAIKKTLKTVKNTAFREQQGRLTKVYDKSAVMITNNQRGIASGSYIADLYKSEIETPYLTDWVFLIGDGCSDRNPTNSKAWYEIKIIDGKTKLTTYYFFIRNTMNGVMVNKWFPTDPNSSNGHRFLLNPVVPIIDTSKEIKENESERVLAEKTINLLPGFEVFLGGSFTGEVLNTVYDEDIKCKNQ